MYFIIRLSGRGARRGLFAIGFLLSVLILTVNDVPAGAQRDTVVLRPKEISDVLVNPGMGITTFQRFNGQALNPPLTWSEAGASREAAPGRSEAGFPRGHDCVLPLVLGSD
jgi:hypothetical protein